MFCKLALFLLFFLSYFSKTGTGSSTGRKACFQENKATAVCMLWSLLQLRTLVRWNIGHLYLLKNVYTIIPLMHDINDWDYLDVTDCTLFILYQPVTVIVKFKYYFLLNLKYSNSTVCIVGKKKKNTTAKTLYYSIEWQKSVSCHLSSWVKRCFQCFPVVLYYGHLLDNISKRKRKKTNLEVRISQI